MLGCMHARVTRRSCASPCFAWQWVGPCAAYGQAIDLTTGRSRVIDGSTAGWSMCWSVYPIWVRELCRAYEGVLTVAQVTAHMVSCCCTGGRTLCWGWMVGVGWRWLDHSTRGVRGSSGVICKAGVRQAE